MAILDKERPVGLDRRVRSGAGCLHRVETVFVCQGYREQVSDWNVHRGRARSRKTGNGEDIKGKIIAMNLLSIGCVLKL